MKIEISRQILEKYSNAKFYETLTSGSRVVLYRWTDKTKLEVTFRNFANAPKNVYRHTIKTPFVLVSCDNEETCKATYFDGQVTVHRDKFL